jgi:hypothetical protein
MLEIALHAGHDLDATKDVVGDSQGATAVVAEGSAGVDADAADESHEDDFMNSADEDDMMRQDSLSTLQTKNKTIRGRSRQRSSNKRRSQQRSDTRTKFEIEAAYAQLMEQRRENHLLKQIWEDIQQSELRVNEPQIQISHRNAKKSTKSKDGAIAYLKILARDLHSSHLADEIELPPSLDKLRLDTTSVDAPLNTKPNPKQRQSKRPSTVQFSDTICSDEDDLTDNEKSEKYTGPYASEEKSNEMEFDYHPFYS